MGVDFHTDRAAAAAVVVDLDAVAAVAAAVVVRVMRSSAVNATEGTRADFHTRPAAAEAAEAAVEAGTAAEATDLAANATRSKRDDAIAAIRADFRINNVLAN